MVLDAAALTGRTVLVTGASGGIGAATAVVVGAAGAGVIAHYGSRREAAELAVADIPDDRAWVLQGDLRTPTGARELWVAANRLATVDVVVLNAAVITPTPVEGSDDDWDAGWQDLLAINVIGPGALMREAVRAYAVRGHGTVIAVSSWAAQQGSRILDAAGYAASKAALRNLAQTFARQYARHGVQVHVVAPGVVDAGMGVAGLGDDQLRQVAAGLAAGRHVGANEVAEVIAFLCTDAAPSLTGSTIDLNGASYVR
jgi:NAD(P)-dependent dehydrogenase (short-subunit alcohol dehydrogenase family)